MRRADELERAYARGFLVRPPLPSPPPRAALPISVAGLARRPGARVALGDRIGPRGDAGGRLGPVLVQGDHLLAFTAGHVFGAEGEDVYRDDQVVGRVVGLIRPRRGADWLDAALLELCAEVAGASPVPRSRQARCRDRVRLAVPGARTGRVVGLSQVARMSDGEESYLLHDQLAIVGRGFATGGDSGAAVLGAAGELLGLLVGGQHGVSVATPLATLRAAFDLQGADWLAVA